MSVTWSFVDMHPSESSRSNVTRVAARSAASSDSAERSASVVSTTSIVARPGASMPAPFAMPPTRHPSPSTTTVFARVSVVMIARAASSPPSADRRFAAESTPSSSTSPSSWSPMSPVEQTSTSPEEMPSADAAASAVRCVTWNPSGPVKQFAPPEFSTIADTRPSEMTCCDQRIGFAFARFDVNTAAACCNGPRFTMSARSSAPERLMPAAIPAASKPTGAVTVTGRLRSREGRSTRRGRARCSRTGPRHPPCPSRGCRSRSRRRRGRPARRSRGP